MVFCGNCGLQLAPGSTTCPRCRAYNNVQEVVEDPHSDDATIASLRSNAPNMPPGQPTSTYPASSAATQYSQQQTVLQPGSNPSHPGYTDPTMLVPGQGAQSSYPPATPYPASGYTPPSSPGFSPYPGQYAVIEPLPPETPQRRGRGTLIALLVVVLLLIIAIGGTLLYVVKPAIVHQLLGYGITPTAAPTTAPTNAPTTQSMTPTTAPTSAPTQTPSQAASAVLVQYYQDVNAQDYQDAWNLWGSAYHNSTTYSQYAAGYANTVHDTLTINSTTTNADGTVTADVSLTADESTNSGPVTSTYQGTYTIGIENGSWKLLKASLQKTS
jgi:flagellar basal body-associated protein FliL